MSPRTDDPLSGARQLAASLQSRGHTLRVSRGKLLVGNSTNLTADDLRAIGREREAMLHLLIDETEWERRRAALDLLPPVRWPGDDVVISSNANAPADSLPSAEGVVILTDGHGWDVAFVAADLEAIIRTYSALKGGKADAAGAAGAVGRVGAGASRQVGSGVVQGDLFGGLAGADSGASGQSLRKDRR